MDKMRSPCIASIFMRNIDQKTVSYQQQVVKKFNPTDIPHYSILSEANPGYTMDKLVDMLKSKGHDAIMFLDIDCVPVSQDSLSYMFEAAYLGAVVGDAQRSNHIDNGQHVFAAPHNVTFSIETYEKLGKPSFMPNYRGDVAEELTFASEENDVPVWIIMPLRFDAPPIRMEWEKDSEPFWRLADGMPYYGIGTTFGRLIDGVSSDMFWHNYQIFHQGQQERFWAKCEQLLKD